MFHVFVQIAKNSKKDTESVQMLGQCSLSYTALCPVKDENMVDAKGLLEIMLESGNDCPPQRDWKVIRLM